MIKKTGRVKFSNSKKICSWCKDPIYMESLYVEADNNEDDVYHEECWHERTERYECEHGL